MAANRTSGQRVTAALKKNWNVDLSLDPEPWPDASLPALVVGAQNYLDSAKASVESALSGASRQRGVRLAFEGKSSKGRYSEADQDLLRAGLLFAGAGCDSALKRLLRDALPAVVLRSEIAEKRLVRFAEEHLAQSDGAVDRKVVARLFLSDQPRDALVESYTDNLTGGSLQSADRFKEVALALGINDQAFLKRIDPGKSLLKDAFTARNEIVHQLDLRDPDTTSRGAKAHRRKPRTISAVTELSTEALSACQYVVNSVAEVLQGHDNVTPGG